MFDTTAQARLREKLDYELWLLDFISKRLEVLEGGSHPSKITLTSKKIEAHVALIVEDMAGAGEIVKILDAMMPLTFTAAYKILDVIFEWILQENYDAKRIARVPWPFSEKVKAISLHQTELVFPPLFQSAPYVKAYLLALYSNLLKFRNEIVHKHRFSVSDNKLIIDMTENGSSFTLEIGRGELSALVRTAVAVAETLAGSSEFGTREDRLLKYYLDQIEKFHSLPRFEQRKPILVDVVFNVPEEKGLFIADLKFVRDKVSQIHPNADVLFNLEVIGLINNQPSISWFFPANAAPRDDVPELSQDSYGERRVLSGTTTKSS